MLRQQQQPTMQAAPVTQSTLWNSSISLRCRCIRSVQTLCTVVNSHANSHMV